MGRDSKTDNTIRTKNLHRRRNLTKYGILNADKMY